MGHTPGPWGYDEDSKEVFSGCEEHGCGWLAYIDGNDSNCRPLPEGMRLANARLIAAAPELLEQCKYLLENAEAAGWSEFMLADARAAIAKAEGRGE